VGLYELTNSIGSIFVFAVFQQIPKSVLDKSSPAYNKGRIGADGSNPAAAEAFAEASRKGLRRFFECRAEEMASGGVLGFYCLGRRDRAHPEKQMFEESIHPFPGAQKAFQELVNEVISRSCPVYLTQFLTFLKGAPNTSGSCATS